MTTPQPRTSLRPAAPLLEVAAALDVVPVLEPDLDVDVDVEPDAAEPEAPEAPEALAELVEAAPARVAELTEVVAATCQKSDSISAPSTRKRSQ